MASAVTLDILLGLKGKEKLLSGFFDIPDPAFPTNLAFFVIWDSGPRMNKSI
jgi:hypothetical protein